jgi:hypothetical protein
MKWDTFKWSIIAGKGNLRLPLSLHFSWRIGATGKPPSGQVPRESADGFCVVGEGVDFRFEKA